MTKLLLLVALMHHVNGIFFFWGLLRVLDGNTASLWAVCLNALACWATRP